MMKINKLMTDFFIIFHPCPYFDDEPDEPKTSPAQSDW